MFIEWNTVFFPRPAASIVCFSLSSSWLLIVADPQILPFYPLTTHHRQSGMCLQPPMCEPVRRVSAQCPTSLQYSFFTLPPVRGRPAPNIDPFVTPTNWAMIELYEHPSDAGYEHPSDAEWLPKSQAISPLALSPTTSRTMTQARNLPRPPRLQIPTSGQLTAITLQTGQPLSGTMPSSTPIENVERALMDTVKSYNLF